MKALDELRRCLGSDCMDDESVCKRYRDCREHYFALIDAAEREVAERYVELPVDADGEVIHVGDVMCLLDEDIPNKVEYMHLCGDGWWVYARGIGVRSKELRHHHAPTVEDVLREFGKAWVEWEDGSPYDPIAKYAAKLRLADDGKEQ